MTSSTAGMPELESPDSFKQGMIMGLAAGYNPLLGTQKHFLASLTRTFLLRERGFWTLTIMLLQ